jgi:hypothetical protein
MFLHALLAWLQASGSLLDVVFTSLWRQVIFPFDGALVGAFITACAYELGISHAAKKALPHEKILSMEEQHIYCS